MDPELWERITARHADLDELEEQPAKQVAKARAERDELAVAERVLERASERLADSVLGLAHAGEGGWMGGDADSAPHARGGGERAPAGLPAAPTGSPQDRRKPSRPRRRTGAGRTRLRPLKTWRALTELRTNPAHATRFLRALLVLTNLEVNR